MATLVVLDGWSPGTHFPITQPLVSVGRDDECTIQILDAMVSRKHLQIRLDAASGKHLAGDYRSAHGVIINGKPIVLDTVLNDGDKIRIGGTTLMYLAEDHADAASASAAAKKKDEWKRSTLMGHATPPR